MNKYKFLILLFLLSTGVKSNATAADQYTGSGNPIFDSKPNQEKLTEEEKQTQLNEQLKEAVKNVDFQKLKELLKQGADINFQNENGDTFLMIVASSLSRNHPISPLIGGGDQPSPHVAISSERWSWSSSFEKHIKKQRDLLKFLVNHNADMNIQNKQGWTVLMMLASLQQDDWAVRFIASQEAELDIQDNKGRTALMFAAFYQRSNSVMVLSQKGANANIKDKYDRTALTYAIETLNDMNVAILSEYTNEAEKSLALKLAEQTEKIIKDVLSVATSQTLQQIQQGEDIHKIKETLKNSQNKPPNRVEPLNEQLIEAVKNVDSIKVIHLLEQGANPNAKDIDGKTVLMLVVGNEREDSSLFNSQIARRHIILSRNNIVDHLISSGANIEATDDEGKTAMIWVVIEGDFGTLLNLVTHGASVLTRDTKHNKTALMWAKDKKRDRIFIQALTKAEAEEQAQLKELEDSKRRCRNTF